MKNGKHVKWEGTARSGEGDDDYYELNIQKSPKELAAAKDIIKNINLNSIVQILFLLKENPSNAADGFKLLHEDYNKRQKEFKKKVEEGRKVLSNMFAFAEEVFKEGQEMLIIVTELTINYHTVQFISHYGCEEYFNHNKELLFYERQKEIISELENIEL